jgi:serine/threonine-protein kinase
VRERAIDALGKAGDVRAVDPLLRLLNRDTKAIPLCVRALSVLHDARVVEPLCRLTSSESAEVRREAIHGLLELSRKEFPDEVREQIYDALDAAGVKPQRTTVRPLEVRARKPAPSPEAAREPAAAAAGGDGTGTTPSGPSHGEPEAHAAARTPSAETPAPLDFQKLPEGTRLIDRFRVVRRIGGGGFGSVYLVEDVVVREELVLKILSPHLSVDESMIRRFVQELKFTRRITHRNVIRIYDLLDLNGAYAISMEYFPGQDLAQILKKEGSLSLDRTLGISAQLCEGLAAAHELGIVHRDIKPPNILVDDAQTAKIVDFGLAWMGEATKSRLTQSGILVGTPEYISPEQITGGEVDGRADLYSLGVVIYEMLSGRQAFKGNNAVNVLFQHLEADVEPLSQVVPTIPAAVNDLVMRCMAKKPADRPESAPALLEMIRAAA